MLFPWQQIIMNAVLAGAASWVLADWAWKLVFWWLLTVSILIRLLCNFPRVRSVSLAKSRLFFKLICEPQLVVSLSYTETQSTSCCAGSFTWYCTETPWTLLPAVIQPCTGCTAASSSELLLALTPAPLCAIDIHFEMYLSRSMLFPSWIYLISN